MFVKRFHQNASRDVLVDSMIMRPASLAESAVPSRHEDYVEIKKDRTCCIPLRRLFKAPTPRDLPVPKAPPSSPAVLPMEQHFNMYLTMKQALVKAANHRMTELIEDYERAKRYAKSGIKTEVRTHPVVAGPIFLGAALGTTGLKERDVQDDYLTLEQLQALDVRSLGYNRYTGDDMWVHSAPYERVLEAFNGLRRWAGKQGLDNVTLSFGCLGSAVINGEKRFLIDSIWLHADPPSIHASFR